MPVSAIISTIESLSSRLGHHLAAIGREFDRVGQEIDEDLLGCPTVRDDGNGAIDVRIELQVLVVGPPGHHPQGFRECPG
jgi:hypothetical protein